MSFRIRPFVAASILLTMFATLITVTPAHANVSNLVLLRRSCGAINTLVTYDSYSEGRPPFFAVITADLNNNGVFGEAGEPTTMIRVKTGGNQRISVQGFLRFRPVPENSTISVTAYEVDSEGIKVSPELTPVSYQCTHRPALTALPNNENNSGANVAVTVRVAVSAITVYSQPSATTTILGGLPKGARANVLAINRRGDWIQIDFQGGQGWIMWKTQAILIGPYSKLPVLPNYEDSGQ
jgi:hypothetical protein